MYVIQSGMFRNIRYLKQVSREQITFERRNGGRQTNTWLKKSFSKMN